MGYAYTISHVTGKNIATADVLSRAPERTTGDRNQETEINLYTHQVMSSFPATEIRLQQIKDQQDRDDMLKQVKKYCISEWPDQRSIGGPFYPYNQHSGDLTVENDLLLKGTRLVIPKSLQKGHLGQITHWSRGHSKV